jgi:hypothetical protein
MARKGEDPKRIKKRFLMKEVCKWLCCSLMRKTGKVVTTIYYTFNRSSKEDALT